MERYVPNPLPGIMGLFRTKLESQYLENRTGHDLNQEILLINFILHSI
jgi:hypothetical protein